MVHKKVICITAETNTHWNNSGFVNHCKCQKVYSTMSTYCRSLLIWNINSKKPPCWQTHAIHKYYNDRKNCTVEYDLHT